MTSPKQTVSTELAWLAMNDASLKICQSAYLGNPIERALNDLMGSMITAIEPTNIETTSRRLALLMQDLY